MLRVAKILSLPAVPRTGDRSINNALAEQGWTKYPGAKVRQVPKVTPSGKYLTGLDENADYIKRMAMTDPQAALTEATRVKERRIRLETMTGLDLGPKSDYYSGVYGEYYNTARVAQEVILKDGTNTFNFADPLKEIEFWWVSQMDHLIAPSMAFWEAGGCKSSVQFYVSNPDAEADVVFKKNMTIASASENLKKMDAARQKKIARLIGLPITENDEPKIVFNYLYSMIAKGTVEVGEYKGQNSVELFNRIAALDDKVLHVKGLVKEAITLRVYSTRNGVVYEGERAIAQTIGELENQLVLDSKQLELLALETRVMDKKKMKNAITSYDYAKIPDILPAVTEQKPINELQEIAKQMATKSVETLQQVAETITVVDNKPSKADNLAKARATKAKNIADKKLKEAGKTAE